jgi:succinate dehydrogenase / fumarate reductase cytochrome b subunit
MAATGVILVGFVIGHMLGNLQIYLGAEALNAYAKFLHSNPGLVWSVRVLLLISLTVHIVGYAGTTLQSLRGRSSRYQAPRRYMAATIASRTMRYTGPLLLLYVVYHLAHLTLGTAHPQFDANDVYRNVVVGFSDPVASGIYIIAMGALGLHLVHGVWSMFQTVGANNGSWTERLRTVATALTAVIVVGNISIPIAVLTGFIR